MSVRAKFKCTAITTQESDGKVFSKQVFFQPVYSSDPESENHSWSQATPAGSLNMTITNPSAFNQFESGKEYFLDISPAS